MTKEQEKHWMAEKSVIYCLLSDCGMEEFIFAEIEEKHFFSTDFAEIFLEMKKMFREKSRIDLSFFLPKNLQICVDLIAEKIGSTSPSFVSQYCEELKNCYFQKYLKEKTAEILMKSERLSPSEIADELEKIRLEVPFSEKISTMKEDCENFYEEYAKRVDMVGGGSICTIDFLDEEILGFEKSELVILAGRPATGKTAFALQMALESAKKGNKVLFCSMEMTKREILSRIASRIGKIPNWKVQKGKAISSLGSVLDVVQHLPLFISDTADFTVGNLHAKILKMERDGVKPDIVFVDYLQLFSGEGKSQYERITKISRDLKILAGKTETPIVALCQFNRDNARKKDRPELHDLRDSGSIEQDANIVLGLWSPSDEDENSRKTVFCSVLKSRNSDCVDVEMEVDFNFQNFTKI